MLLVIHILKNLIKNIISFWNHIFWRLSVKNYFSKDSHIIFSTISVDNFIVLKLENACLKRVSLNVVGLNNILIINGVISSSKILVVGNNNKIIVHTSVSINNSTLIIRGENCSIEIGKNSTFGGIYIVCMGINNVVKIGEQCMFAENVELWASDAHPIYDCENILLNPSKPIVIGDHVWVGKNTTILKGVNIGNGSVVGMSTIVTKNIDHSTLNVGFPQRPIKKGIRWDRNFIDI